MVEESKNSMAEAQNELAGAMNQIRSGIVPRVDDKVDKTESKVANNDENDDTDDEDKSESEEGDADFVHPGAEFVEIDDPKIQKRINYLTKQIKGSDETNKVLRNEMAQLSGALQQVLATNEEMAKRLNAREAKESSKENLETLNNLRHELEKAVLEGDEKGVSKYTEALADFKADMKIAAINIQAEQPQKINNAPATLEFDAGTVNYLQHLAAETDDDGKQLRPWLNSTHADFDKAVTRANEILTESANKGKAISMVDVMVTLDKEMRQKAPKKSATQEVLSSQGDLTTPVNSRKIRLSDDEMRVARKMGLTSDQYKEQKALLSKAQSATRVTLSDF